MYRYLLLAAIVVAVPATSDTIILDNGQYLEAPEGYKAVFVPESVKGDLISVNLVDVVIPKPVPVTNDDPELNCHTPGELVLGPSVPCEF